MMNKKMPAPRNEVMRKMTQIINTERGYSESIVPLMIEIIGETGVGKTYLASTAPKPFLIDTSSKGEASSTFKKVGQELYKTDFSKRYVHAKDFDDVVKTIKLACENPEVYSIIIDNSSDLQDMARDKYLSSMSTADKKRVSAIQIEYGKIRDLVDVNIVFNTTAMPPNGAGKNLILTSMMKDNYKQVLDASQNVKAILDGRKRDGYARTESQCDIRLYMSIEEACPRCGKISKDYCTSCINSPTKLKRFSKVVKNRFLNRVSDDWIPQLSTNDWDGIKGLVFLAQGEKLLE